MFGLRPSNKQTVELERHEAKYIIPPAQIPEIREFIAPFCEPDDHGGGGTLPEYVVTTLQLDTPNMAFYHAKEHEANARFKLRIRTYDFDGACPVFLEVKRKIKGVIVKSRATIPAELWGADLIVRPGRATPFRTRHEEMNYLNFVRLVQETGARPVVLIRYHREAYLGRNDRYARLTFDRKLCYRPTRDWELFPKGGHWWSMDSAASFGRPYSAAILELKTFADAPMWMVDLTERFNLQRVGYCKYFAAVRLDSLFRGAAYSEASENCTIR